MIKPTLVPIAALLAAGCATEGAVFVTKTSLSLVDLDSTPAEVTFGVNRIEGFIAPRNRNGDSPPVLAHLQSDRGLLQPNIQQVYATGTAAERLAGDPNGSSSNCSETECSEPTEGKPLIFSTSTNIGIRIGLGAQITSPVDGLVLGYRRKEMSYVPVLAKDQRGNYRYPSLIAAIRLAGPSAEERKGFSACQGFATGNAATALAAHDDAGFGCLDDQKSVRQLLTSRQGVELRQQAEITGTLRCYAALPDEPKKRAREQAEQLGVLAPRAAGETTKVAGAGGGIEPKLAAYQLGDADGDYAMRLLLGTVPPAAKAPVAEPVVGPLELAAQEVEGNVDGFLPAALKQQDTPAPAGEKPARKAKKEDHAVPLGIAAALREQLLRAHRVYVCGL